MMKVMEHKRTEQDPAINQQHDGRFTFIYFLGNLPDSVLNTKYTVWNTFLKNATHRVFEAKDHNERLRNNL